MMTKLLLAWILPPAFVGSILFLMYIALLRPIKRLSARFKRIVLICICCSFLIPFAALALVGGNTDSSTTAHTLAVLQEIPATKNIYSAGAGIAQTLAVPPTNHMPQNASPNLWQSVLHSSVLPFALYAAGAGISLLLTLCQYFIFVRKIKQNSMADESYTNAELMELMPSQHSKIPAQFLPKLRWSSHVSTPIVFGVFRPVLVLPNAKLSPSEQAHALRHELCHWASGDLILNWLFVLVRAAHWFNPMAYLLQREFSQVRESACDESVTKSMSAKQRHAYANTLLQVSSIRMPFVASSMSSSGRQLKNRLLHFLRPAKKTRGVRAIAFSLAALVLTLGMLAGCSLSAGMNSSSSSPLPTPSPPPASSPASTSPDTSSEPSSVLEGSKIFVFPLPDVEYSAQGFVSGTHYAIDLNAPAGSSIIASQSGTVTASGWGGAYGNTVKIDHGDGIETVYAHCQELLVATGATVTSGQVIATVGATGNATASLCHFEVIVDGERVNPLGYVVPPFPLGHIPPSSSS